MSLRMSRINRPLLVGRKPVRKQKKKLLLLAKEIQRKLHDSYSIYHKKKKKTAPLPPIYPGQKQIQLVDFISGIVRDQFYRDK